MRPYSISDNDIAKAVGGKRVLITGAGGSIGSVLASLVARGEPESIIILSHSEHSLFSVEQALRQDFPDLECRRVLGDVRSMERMDQVFDKHRPQVVFHTAAIKHVPLAEENPCETVLTIRS